MKVFEEQHADARMKSRRTLLAELSEALRIVAPGTELRKGIDNIIRAGNGGLIVVADPGSLGSSLISGGLKLDCGFTAMRLYELAKRVPQRVVDEFGSLKRLAEVSENDLCDVEGVGRARAHAVRQSVKHPQQPATSDGIGR